jgi:hypothetical protein
MNPFKYIQKAFTVSLLSLAMISACNKDETTPGPGPSSGASFTTTTLNDGTIRIEGSTGKDYTFETTKSYLLSGFVYVDSGATLTIQPGTIIRGDKASKGTLIIRRGGKINANGTAQAPIVFTSDKEPGSRNPGDWGGLIICGKAPVNLPGGEAQIEGGPSALYGGSNPNDNSGVLRYVRIEYAGIPFQPNQEINGLTLGGVGQGTQIEYIQISYCGDDSYEMFGGNVNLKYIISYKTTDDDLDTDNGYTGKVQFGVVLRDANIADVSGSNAFESDNDATGTALTPNTKGVFSNISVFGPKQDTAMAVNSNFKRGAHLRRNTQTCIYNSLISGFPVGLLVDGTSCEANANSDALQVRNTVIAACNTPLSTASGSSFNISNWFTTSPSGNSIQFESTGLCVAPYASTPNFLPAPGSILLSGADFANQNMDGLEVVPFRGAFGTSDWTTGWANWDPQNTIY